jgi:hypothetical protein
MPPLYLAISLIPFCSSWEWDQPPLQGSFSARVGHGAAGFFPSGAGERMVACGGEGASAAGCDRLVPSSAWAVTPVVTPAQATTIRYDHAVAVLGAYLISFGGCARAGGGNCSGGDALGSVEAWDWGSWVLQNATDMRPSWAPRWGHTATALRAPAGAGSPCSGAAVRGCLLIWGGVDAAGRNLAEFAAEPDSPSLLALVLTEDVGGAPALEFAPQPGEPFLSAEARGPVPPARHYHAAAAAPGGGALLVSGGFSVAAGAALSDLWQLDVAAFPWVWSQRFPAPGGAPPPLYGHRLLAAASGWLLLFGGAGGGAPLLLASPAFALAPNGSFAGWAAPPGVAGEPPAAGFRATALLLDVNGDGTEEAVVLGGAAGAGGARSSQLSVLYGIGRARPSAAQQLPWELAGAAVAVLVLGALGYAVLKQRDAGGGGGWEAAAGAPSGGGAAAASGALRSAYAFAAAAGGSGGARGERSPLLEGAGGSGGGGGGGGGGGAFWDYGALESASAGGGGGAFEEEEGGGGGGGAGALPLARRPRSLSQVRRVAAGGGARGAASGAPRRAAAPQKGIYETLEAGLSLMGERRAR